MMSRVPSQQAPCSGEMSPRSQTQGVPWPGRDSRCVRLLLGEDSQDEVSLLVWLKGRRHNDVLAGGQPDLVAHLPQVDEGLGPCPRLVSQEEVLLQVHMLAALGLGE